MNFKEEVSAFFHAMEYFTRIPKPGIVEYNELSMGRGVRYFPLIGFVIGFLAALSAGVVGIFISSMEVAVLVLMISGILLSGGLHEDGLADFVDGFGSSREKEKILKVMKDSRIGAFGTMALVLSLLCKFVLLKEIGKDLYSLVFYFILAQVVSRAVAILISADLDYVSIENAKAKFVGVGKTFSNRFNTILGIGILALLISHGLSFFTYLVVISVFFVWLRSFLKKRLGGFTGDCLGFAQQIAELLYYLTIVYLLQP